MTSAAVAFDPRRAQRCLRYRLDVVAVDVADIVRSAGGWLYHRVAAGWEVNVLVPGNQDARPLQILGARTHDLDGELAGLKALDGHSLAVSAGAFAIDARVRRWLLSSLENSRTEVTLWGNRWPIAVSRRLRAAQYPLTVAGRAFKAQALAAAGASVPVAPVESFVNQTHCLPVLPDLVAVG